METQITFQSENLQIEGLFSQDSETRGVVVTHPHPLYGGDMHNSVVATIVGAYQQNGYATLRFNFRGVGRSQGRFDDGRGEANDVLSALAFLSENGLSELHLVGYSFGAWVNARITPLDATIFNMVMVSPPIGFIDFPAGIALDALSLVITGGRDDIAPAAMIQARLPQWNPKAQLAVIQGADHFYGGYSKELESILRRHC